jgi:hypothetical protein
VVSFPSRFLPNFACKFTLRNETVCGRPRRQGPLPESRIPGGLARPMRSVSGRRQYSSVQGKCNTRKYSGVDDNCNTATEPTGCRVSRPYAGTLPHAPEPRRGVLLKTCGMESCCNNIDMQAPSPGARGAGRGARGTILRTPRFVNLFFFFSHFF